jgi:hypothetical protein
VKRNNAKNIVLKQYFAVFSYVKRKFLKRKLLNRSEAKNLKQNKRKKAKRSEKIEVKK